MYYYRSAVCQFQIVRVVDEAFHGKPSEIKQGVQREELITFQWFYVYPFSYRDSNNLKISFLFCAHIDVVNSIKHLNDVYQ